MVIGVLVDANVLRSRTLRDWLFLLREHSDGSLFTVHATEDIVAEVVYTMRRDKPDLPGRVTKQLHDLIMRCLDDVVSDYTVDGSFEGADENDAHVHAAALACEAGLLLTADKGFTAVPEHVDDTLPYEVHTPDSFFTLVDDSAPLAVRTVTERQAAFWSGRQDGRPLVDALRDADCPRFAARVALHQLTLHDLT